MRQQGYRADVRDKKAARETGKTNAEHAGHNSTQEGPDNSDDEVGQQAKRATHHLLGDTAGKDADEDGTSNRNLVLEIAPPSEEATSFRDHGSERFAPAAAGLDRGKHPLAAHGPVKHPAVCAS